MPIYEYECEKCGHRFELIQKYSDKPKTRCPKCRGALRKLPSAPAIQFKGSGWYVTDYAKKSGSADPGEPSRKSGAADKGKIAETPAAGGSGEGKSESKEKSGDSASSGKGGRGRKGS